MTGWPDHGGCHAHFNSIPFGTINNVQTNKKDAGKEKGELPVNNHGGFPLFVR